MTKTNNWFSVRATILGAAVTGVIASPVLAVNGNWANDVAGNWSDATKWTSNPSVAGGQSSVVGLTAGLATSRIVTIDTTSRTVGTLNIGDTNDTNTYTIAASGGASLIMDNAGSGASINQISTSRGDSITAPISLLDNLSLTNASSTRTLTLSAISAGSAGTKTITASTGAVTIGGIISPGSGNIAIVQNGPGTLTLNGMNTFGGGVTINAGAVVTGNDVSALGTGAVLLGNTSGSDNATLYIGSGRTANPVANAITVRAGTTGILTISSNGGTASRLNSDVLLNNNLVLATNAAGGNNSVANTLPYMQAAGTFSGTGNLSLNVSGLAVTSNNTNNPLSSSMTVTGAVTTSGALTNVGTGTGWVGVSGAISNVSNVTQNSATSMMILSGTNTYTSATNVSAGVLRLSSAGAVAGSTSVNVASGSTLQLSTNVTAASGATLTVSGNGTSYTGGAIEAVAGASYGAAVVLAGDSTFSSAGSGSILTLAGGVSGAGQDLTVTGAGNTVLSGSLGTGSGALTKTGTGALSLNASNSFTGITSVDRGVIQLGHASALGGGGDISFGGGVLRHTSSNLVDYASRIVNSDAAIIIDTNAQNVTYAGNLGSSNTGGLTKIGTGRLTLSGTNSYTGITAVNNGALAYSSTSAISSGGVFIDAGGALNSGGAYANVNAWLASGTPISSSSTGAIALTGSSSESISFAGFSNLMLGASTNATYSGTITAAAGTYRLGGGGATLTLGTTNQLTGSNNLVVGARNGTSTSSGAVTLSAAQDLSGTTTVNVGSLNLSGTVATLTNSDVSVNNGSTLAATTAAATAVTRAKSLTLNRGVFTLGGNATTNTNETITNALTIGAGGNSTVTLTPNASRIVLLNVGELARSAGGTALIRGTNLGASPISPGTNGAANILITQPNLVGAAAGGTQESIVIGAAGDTSATGTGFGATGGLLTHDTTNGLRLVSAYKTSITDGQTALDNVRLSSSSGVVTTTLNSDTTINSLSIFANTATGAAVAVNGSGKLTLNSGTIYSGSVTATTASTISNNIDFNGREGIILAAGSADLTFNSGVLSNTANKGLTIYASGRTVTFGAGAANTYTGTTTINAGTLSLVKGSGVTALPGDVVINTGATLSHSSSSNQIADSASINVNGGTFTFATTETINNLTVSGGSASLDSTLNVSGDLTITNGGAVSNQTAGKVNVTGATNLSDGGTLNLLRSQSVTGGGVYDTVTTLSGGLNITNTVTGTYAPITINPGVVNAQKGGQLVLGGTVTFTGNSTNSNSTFIDAPVGGGNRGVIVLAPTAGSRTFNVGNGAAAVDLTVAAPMINGSGVDSGLTKSGVGTLLLTGNNTFTGTTAVNAGTLIVGDGVNGSLGATAVTVNSDATLAGTGSIGGTVTVNSGGTLAPGNSPGLQSVGGLALTDGGNYNWQLVNATGVAGSGYDSYAVTGSLDLSGLTGATKFKINLWTLAGTGPDVNGNAANFDNTQNYAWTLAATPNTITGFDASEFQINTSALNGTSGFSNALGGGSFAVALGDGGTDLVLTFTAVPEPATLSLLGFGAAALLRRRRSLN